jgi:D-alanyl-D-alanine carboxypeptidase
MSFIRFSRSLARPVAGLTVAMLISAGIVGCGGGNNNGSTQPFSAETQSKLDTALNNTRAALNIPGVIVSLYIPGEGFWETTAGVEDKQTQAPMMAGMHTRIGSITKTFTVTAILLLADDKKLKLDDPVSKYLDFVPNGDNITLRQLANMTSGLYSYTFDDAFVNALLANPYQTYTAQQLVNFGFTHAPSFTPPGSNIQYCNSNTVLLGMVVAKVSGRKVEDFIAERICRPLGLNNTTWPTNGDMPSPFAHGYTKQTPSGNEADATFFNPSWGNAAGQMISSLEDLKKWAKALGEGTLLSPEMQTERLTWAPFGSPTFRYGMGIGYYNGWIGHTGSLPGYNTGVYYLPAKKAILVIQTNTDIPRIITPGNPPVQEEPVNGVFREIAKIVTPDNIPDGNDFTEDDLAE